MSPLYKFMSPLLIKYIYRESNGDITFSIHLKNVIKYNRSEIQTIVMA